MTGVTKATPLPIAAKGRATPQQQKTFTAWEIALRQCIYCKMVYVNGGYRWRCEHWHEGQP